MKQFVKTVFFASCVSAALSSHVSAQTAADGGGKQVCESIVWDGGDPSDEASRYSWRRSIRSDNFMLLWDRGFGDDPRTAPALAGRDMTCDPQHVLDKCEEFYAYYRDTLKFLDEGSNADRYLMMCMLNYVLDDTAYGGSVGDAIGALWVTPARVRDEKLNCIAHELGHAFQFQLSIDSGSGFGGGSAYEMTSQWMLWQVNPDWIKDEEYHWHDFMRQTHLAFADPANMYHSPYVLEYWSSRYGKPVIGRLWRVAHHSPDMVEVYKRMQGMSQHRFCDEMFDACRRFMTYDLPRVRANAAPYANRHASAVVAQEDGWYAIAPELTPRQYGYNGIRLSVPEAGRTVWVEFEGMADESDPTYSGWRFGLVGVRKDGTAVYPPRSSASLMPHNDFSCVVTGLHNFAAFTVPEDEELAYLWLVVMAAPTSHRMDFETEFPYRFRVFGSSPQCEVRGGEDDHR